MKDFVNIVRIQVLYDFISDQFESEYHLDDVAQTVNDNLEDFLRIGCEPAKLASMMDPAYVLARIDLFKGIDINPVAKRLNNIDTIFDQLVSLGVKADSIRNHVAKWNGETIINHLAGLRKCGFSKKELGDLLYKKISEYGPSFGNAEYLSVICKNEHLYQFLSRECLKDSGDGGFCSGYFSDSLPFDVAALVKKGADKTVISEWVANHMCRCIFDTNLYNELHKYGVFPNEKQIINALWSGVHRDAIYDWMHEVPNPNSLFMEFMNNSEHPYELISELDDLSDHEIIDAFWYLDSDKDDFMKYRNVWKAIFTLMFEKYPEEREAVVALEHLHDQIKLSEAEWKAVLSGRKEQLESCIKESESDSDFREDVELLKHLRKYAS